MNVPDVSCIDLSTRIYDVGFLNIFRNLERDTRLFQCEFHLYNLENNQSSLMNSEGNQPFKNGAPSFP